MEKLEAEQNMQGNIRNKDISPLLQQIRQESQLYTLRQKFPKIAHDAKRQQSAWN